MWRLIFLALASPAVADAVVATRVIAARSVLTNEDIALVAADIPGALTDLAPALGQEARITLFPGRPVHASDIGPSTKVERNQIIPLTYLAGSLAILTEGRALERGGEGDVIGVMNLTSRTTVFGKIDATGGVLVTSPN